MSCPEIKGLTFSPSGLAAIEEIRRIQDLGKALAILMASGVLMNIFLGKEGLEGPIGSAWNISQNDWQTWSHATASIPVITRRRIRDIAGQAYFKSLSTEEREFWKAVADGCSY